jgi:Mg-chelatase subunit ChlD
VKEDAPAPAAESDPRSLRDIFSGMARLSSGLATMAQHGGDDKGDQSWQFAELYHEMKRQIPSAELRRRARDVAARAILKKAESVVGASRRSAPPTRLPYSISPRGEIAIEETLENLAGYPAEAPISPHDIVMETREHKHVNVVLMIDTSLSMTGKNLALAGVSAAVLALKLRSTDYSLVVFEGAASVAKKMAEPLGREDAISRILEVPAMGYTNIEDALKKGLAQLEKGRNQQRMGLLITDGVYTEGGDPLPWASKFPRLHVLMTKAYKMDRSLCARMAEAGHGHCFAIDTYEELPIVMGRLMREVLR